MDTTQESPALDQLATDSPKKIEARDHYSPGGSDISESENDSSGLVSFVDIDQEDIFNAALHQLALSNRTSVNSKLCDLCRKCIGDIITGDCFMEAASNRRSRWSYEKTPMKTPMLTPTSPRGRTTSELSFRFYENIQSVEASALRQCELCLLITRKPWQSCSAQMYISVIGLLSGSEVTIKDTTKEAWMVVTWMRGKLYRQDFFPYVQEVDPWVLNSKQQEWQIRNTGSDEVMDTVRSWMSECIEKHPLCARKPSPLPTRVIDVGQSDSSADPYLFESDGLVAPYLAVSYCWGSGKRFISTSDSIATRREGFMVAELPQTLQDAISTTRRLGIRYLWIDALCIIQDDHDDWQSESSSMRAVYRNALFVISALDACHSDSGMFYDRNALISDETSATGTGLSLRENPLSPLRQNPLSERAWALQERFVATASLHFTRRRLCWECRTCSLFEDGLRRDHHPVTKAFPKSYWRGRRDVTRPIDVVDWYHLVHLYSSKQLSHTSDKLAAIAGLATEFEDQGWCQGYFVGLWRGDLQRGLLWSASPRRQFEGHNINPQYPSWSWASSEGSVSWDDFKSNQERTPTRYDSDLEDMRVELSDDSKTATLVRGSITFTVFMLLLSNDELVPPYIEESRQAQILRKRGQGLLEFPTKRPCWLARMTTWKFVAGLEPRLAFFQTHFLLLEEVRDKDVFRRVGTFEITHYVADEQLTIHEMLWKEVTII